jgi:hypothetical protein
VGVHGDQVEEHKAVIRDISVAGACFLTRVEIETGEPVRLNIQLTRDPKGKVIETDAKVVRVEQFEPERADVWTCSIAVEFDEPLEGLDDEIDELAARLKKAGLPW